MKQGIRIKTIILLWLLLIDASSAKAQNYIPFPSSNVTWSDGIYFWSGWQTDTSYHYYRTAGEVNINDTLYSIISSETADHYGYYRVDGQKVFFRYNGELNEFLLYNFNLAIGDTMYLPMTDNNIVYYEMGEVFWIDSVLIGSTYRSRVHISSSWIEVAFIEGVGSDQGLLYCEIPWVDWYGFLGCFSLNDTIYSIDGSGTTSTGDCWETMGIAEYNSVLLIAYPNPFTTSTTIEYELHEPSHIQLTIYNSIGEEVYRAEDRLMSVEKHTFTWSADRLPVGLYYAVLRSEYRVSVVKMVKQ